MDIKPGDIVKFLNETGGGKVTKIIDKKTALVEIEEGFEFPYLISELIKVEIDDDLTDYQKVSEPNKPDQIEKQLEEPQEEIQKDNEEINIYFAIVPENQLNPTEGNYDIVLVNDSNWYLLYLLEFKKELYESYPGILQPNLQEIITSLTFEELKEYREIDIKILLYRSKPHQKQETIHKKFVVRPDKLVDSYDFKPNDLFDGRAKIFVLLEKNPLEDAIKKLKKKDIEQVKHKKEYESRKINKHKNYRSPKQPEKIEVDLHIDALLDDTTGMTPKDILDYQMEVFKKELEKALKNPHIKKIIFIHGRGNGSLRTEIRKELQRRKLKFSDASFQKYGFGATEVYVSKKFY